MSIILFCIIGAIGFTKSVQAYNYHVLYVETPLGQVLEMPFYQEQAINETIPGQERDSYGQTTLEQETIQTMNHVNLSRVLLCITKPEHTEPFPYELN